MHVWACKVVSGEFVRGQVQASHCLHRMGEWEHFNKSRHWMVARVSLCSKDGEMEDPDIGLKHKMP